MLVKNFYFALGLVSLGLTQDIDDNDVPQQCRSVCASIVSLTQNCDNQNTGFINCVCNASGASTQIPLCEACVAQFDNDGHDNDVNDLVRSCSFSTTTFNPSAATASASLTQVSGSNSIAIPTTAVTTGSSDDSASTRSSGGSTTTSQGVSQTTGSVAGQSTNAAPTMGAGVGVGIGILGVAIGMM